MSGIENGFHRSIPLLVLITLLFSACGGLPPTLTVAQSVLAAIDNGPIDSVGYAYQPVILQKLPSIGSA